MPAPTNLSSWIERLTYAVVTVALVSAVVSTVASSTVTAPAMQWVKVAGGQVLTSLVG